MPHYIVYCPGRIEPVFSALSVIGDTNTDHVGIVGFRGAASLDEMRRVLEEVAEGEGYLILEPKQAVYRGDGAIESIGRNAEDGGAPVGAPKA